MSSSDPSAPTDPAGRFASLFATSEDPWHYRTSWYEARKRAMTLACLTRQHYGRAFEPACANGVLSAALAPHCGSLVISDVSERAVELARQAVARYPNVEARCQRVPGEWPEGRFDLVVLSEFVYYLEPEELERLAARVRECLADDGTVLACHWRHSLEGYELDADVTHDRLHRLLDLTRATQVLDADFRMDVWSRDRRSIAAREGLVAESR